MEQPLIDIRAIREAQRNRLSQSGPLSQQALADLVGVNQSVISRAERDPESTSLELVHRICTALGMTLGEVLQLPPLPHGLIMRSNPAAYRLVDEIRDQIQGSIISTGVGLGADGSSPTRQAEKLRTSFGTRPQLVIAGPFDAGKSTLVNLLLDDGAAVPVRYQPMTSVVTYVRHMDEKPKWCDSQVLVLADGFDSERWGDETHVRDHMIAEGDPGILREWASHASGQHSDAAFAIMFHEAEILRTCSIVDTPGDDHSEEDSTTTSMQFERRTADVLIYMSPAAGFLSKTQLLQFERRLSRLADIGPEMVGKNLFVLVSHASPAQIADGDVEQLLDQAADRFRRHVSTEDSPNSDDPTLTQAHSTSIGAVLRSRMFPFYRGSGEGDASGMRSRGQEFLDDLALLLNATLPDLIGSRDRKNLADFCKVWRDELGQELQMIDAADEEAELAEHDLPRLEREAEQAKVEIRESKQRLKEAVERHRLACDRAVQQILLREVNERLIESTIRNRYSKEALKARTLADQKIGPRKLARDEMPGLMVRRFTGAVERDIEDRARAFANELENELSKVDVALRKITWIREGKIPLDVKGALVGGAMSGVAVGAFALWASTLGNLGAYIIAAQAAGWLAALGISLPAGGATLTAGMAAIGGPIGVAVAVVAIGLIIGMQFRADWEKRLAMHIAKALHAKTSRRKESLADTVRTSVGEFWDSTASALERGMQAVIDELEAKIETWRRLIDPSERQAHADERVRIEITLRWVAWLETLTGAS